MLFTSRGLKSSILGSLLALAIVTGCANVESRAHPVSSVDMAGTLFAETGPNRVTTQTDLWNDAERGRNINVKLYVPDTRETPPVVIFSHGLGGSVDAAPYLGRHLASWGILTIHIQHPGSDSEVWRGLRSRAKIFAALGAAARDPKNSIDRFEDLHFVLDELERRAASGTINADTSRVGMAGHSFGAHSVLAAAGRRSLSTEGLVSFKDERLLAGMALSPPAPARWATEDRYDDHYGDIDLPLLHVTGTEDENPLNRDQSAATRQIPFGQIDGAPQYLIVFEGADHSVFGGMNRRGSPGWYPDTQARVAQAGTIFFQAYLNNDARSLDLLNGPGLNLTFGDVAETKQRP